MRFLGIDAGTTGIKAAIFDQTGRVCGVGLQEYSLETPEPDIVELSPEVYWQATLAAISEAAAKARLKPGSIRAVGITGQAETLIKVDRDGEPVGKAIVWLDNRAKEEAAFLERRFGAERLFCMSGQTAMLPCWPAAKILWLKNHRPDEFKRTKQFLMVEDFLAFRLTGEYATCTGLMPSSLYYDIRSGGWENEILTEIGIGADALPFLHSPGRVIGRVMAKHELFLHGAVVSIAPIDHVCGNLGSGCVKPGQISETTGCSLAICADFDRLLYDEDKRISTYLGFRDGHYALLPWAPTAGMLLKYFRENFASETTFGELDRLAEAIPPGSEGLTILPHAAGAVSPVCNPSARATAYGITLAHNRGHWARAIMESVAFLLRDNIETLKALEVPVSEIRSLGGGAKSDVWLRIKADTLGIPVRVTDCEEPTALGAAILGAVADGYYATAEEAVRHMVRTGKTVEPGENSQRYSDLFGRYRDIDRLILPTFKGENDL